MTIQHIGVSPHLLAGLIALAGGNDATAAAHSPILPGTVKLECSLEKGEGSYLAASGATTPSKIKVRVTNGGNIDVAVRFDLHLTATNGAKSHYDRQGKTFIRPGTEAAFEFLPFTDQQGVNGPPVFAKTCTLVHIAACPSNPPSNWPKTAEYSPFVGGTEYCTKLRNVGPLVLTPAPKDLCPSDSWMTVWQNGYTSEYGQSVELQTTQLIHRWQEGGQHWSESLPYANVTNVELCTANCQPEYANNHKTLSVTLEGSGGRKSGDQGDSYPQSFIRLYFTADDASAAQQAAEYFRCRLSRADRR